MSGFGGLFVAEVRRFGSRRLFRGLGIAIVGLIVALATITFIESSKDPNAAIERAREDVARCEAEERRFSEQHGGSVEFGCGTVEDLAVAYDDRYLYARNQADTFQGLGVMFMILGLVAAGSFVGAEWGTGSMTTFLTWEPRRGRVLLAKWLACVAIVSVIVVGILAFVAAIFFPVAVLRGTTEGSSASFWWSQLGIAARDVFLGVFGASFGVSLAMLVRSTAGAIGAGFFYGAIVDFLLSIWREGFLERWVLRYNIARLLDIPVAPAAADGFEGQVTFQLMDSAARSAVILAVYAAVFLFAAYAVFRRRDVT